MAAARANPLVAGAAFIGVGTYAGATMRETGTAAAVVRLWDNASAASGTLIAVLGCALGGVDKHNTAITVAFVKGIFVEVVGTGVVEGAIYLN